MEIQLCIVQVWWCFVFCGLYSLPCLCSSITGRTSYTAAEGHRRAVSMLLQHGANVNARNNDEVTPLHKAAMASHRTTPPLINLYSPSNWLNRVCVDSAHCCRLLLAADADKDAADLYGATPLMKVRHCPLWPRRVDSLLSRRLNTTCRAPLCCCWTLALPTCAIKRARLPRALLHASNTTKLLLRLPIGLKNIVNCSCFSFVFCHRYFSQQFYLKKSILK